MQYSIVNYRDLEKGSLRFDSEYYHPQNLLLLQTLKSKSHNQIGDFAFVTDGIHASIDFDENSKINLLSAKAPKENYFDLSGTGFISKAQDEKNKRTRLKKDDVVISTVGTIGNCAVVDENILPANSDRHVGIIRIEKGYQPYFLSSFLLSKYGRFQTFRESTGNVQLNLFIYKIKEIIVPNLPQNFQKLIQDVCVKAHELKTDSVNFYSQAEVLLLSELRLTDWKPKHTLAFVKNFSDTQKAERIDAEYFQPKYEEIVEAVKKYKGGFDKMGNLTKLIGHPSNPPYETINTENKTFIITQKHLSNYFPVDNFWKDEEALYTTDDFIEKNKKYILQDNDIILYSVGAYIGKANLYNANIKATIGSFLTLIRPKIEKINPFYLLVFLNSKIGQELTRRNSRGLAQQYIYPYDTRQVIVPILEISKQKEIERLILSGQKSHNLSKSLLEIAKRGVEMAIEKNEQEAGKWIENELKALKIEI